MHQNTVPIVLSTLAERGIAVCCSIVVRGQRPDEFLSSGIHAVPCEKKWIANATKGDSFCINTPQLRGALAIRKALNDDLNDDRGW